MTLTPAGLFKVELSRYIRATSKQVLIEQPVDPRRVFFLRPSSLPFCGLRRFFTFATKGIPTSRFMDSGGHYNVNMGTQAHELVQDVMARGGRIWGDWECSSCRHKRHWSTLAACPKCGSRMNYHEIEVAWRAWRGHIDGVYQDSNGDFWIIDYKTTSEAKIVKGKIEVAVTYRAQQERYVVFVEQKYQVKVKGWALIYASRDNIYTKNHIITEVISTAKKEALLKQAILESNLHKKMWKIASVADLDPFVEHKLCGSVQDHNKNFPWEACPFKDKCFDEGKRLRALKATIRDSKFLPLIGQMPDTIRHELYRSPLFIQP